MPRGDGTGPAGMGPMTGRGAGYCAGYDRPGYMNPSVRGGFGGGGGRGRGMGRRNWARATGMPGWARAARGMPAWGQPAPGYVPPTPAAPGAAGTYQPNSEGELQVLRQQAEALNEQLSQINERITELEEQQED
ncbi:MAG: DUF5320 domain-containing protein [Planctomycetota bacterium]